MTTQYRHIIYIGILISTIFTSCVYKPKDFFEPPILYPQPPVIKVNQFTQLKDTVYFYSKFNPRIKVDYDFDTGDYLFKGIGIRINNNERLKLNNSKGSFYLSPEILDPGVNNVELTIYTNLNTGSLTDELGIESYMVKSKGITVILFDSYYKPELKTNLLNDNLKLTWEKYLGDDFQYYIVRKRAGPESGSNSPYEAVLKEIKTTSTEFIDDDYCGEHAYYEVKLVYGNKESEVLWGGIHQEKLFPVLQWKINSQNQYVFFWKDIKLQNKIRTVKLFAGANYENIKEISILNKNGNGEYVITDFGFLNTYLIFLSFEPYTKPPKFDNLYLSNYASLFYGVLGNKNVFNTKIFPISNTSFIYNKNFKLFFYSLETGRDYDSIATDNKYCTNVPFSELNFSASKKTFSYLDNCNGNLIVSPVTNPYNKFSCNIGSETGSNIFNNFRISDNKLVLYSNYEEIILFDLNSKKIIDDIKNNTSIYDIELSQNGNYFYVKTSSLMFYKVENSKIKLVWKSEIHQNPYTYISYDALNAEKIILFDGKNIIHKRSENFSTEKSFSVEGNSIISTDFFSRRVLVQGNDRFLVYQLDTGDLLETVPTTRWLQFNSCELIGKYILSFSGYSHKLQNL